MKKNKKNENLLFKLSLALDGKIYQTNGKTIYDALSKIKPVSAKGWGTVEIIYDGRKSKIPLRINPTNLKRMFEKDVDRALFAKRLLTLL